MEEYNNQLGQNSSFLFQQQNLFPIINNNFHLVSSTTHHECYDHHNPPPYDEAHPTVKTDDEAVASTHHHHHHHQHAAKFQVALEDLHHHESSSSSSMDFDATKAKIMAHPHYSNLLLAYLDCYKVGAPPGAVEELEAVRREFEARRLRASETGRDAVKDTELDQFMEAYCDMLVKYREELTRPFEEAMDYMGRIQTELNMLCDNGHVQIFNSGEKCDGVGDSSEEDEEKRGSGDGGTNPETIIIDDDDHHHHTAARTTEDEELKKYLLTKYSGYLSSLKQELSKKKKKGKLPKEARHKLLTWWELHYKWPYPSESEKIGLAESTGLDQKQINNWFINQRKRHWKPSEDTQFMVMDGLHHPVLGTETAASGSSLYMDAHHHHYMPQLGGPYRLLGPS